MSNCVTCKVAGKCGGCKYIDKSYEETLAIKQKYMDKLLGKFCKVEKIVGMKDPFFYRNKVHHVMDRDKAGNAVHGIYAENSHRVIWVDKCYIEDEKSQTIISTVASLCKSFKIMIYNERSGLGYLKHVLVRRGFSTGEIMVVLVTTGPIFTGKNNFVKALLKVHPEITTIVMNINDRDTTMVLGDINKPMYGPGFIKDTLCGCTFRISPTSFYQVNPVQTEVLYKTAIEFAGLAGRETVIDAYCGIGTIGLCVAASAGNVIGVELNKNAVSDAITNAKENKISNARFYKDDAGEFMEKYASQGNRADVVIMDPPRSGSTEKFMDSVLKLNPEKVVYISCGPEALKRDLEYFTAHGMKVKRIKPVDMFPMTDSIETVCLLSR